MVTVGLDRRRVGKRQHILSAARDLMLRDGPRSVTIAATAHRADVSVPTVRKHWQTRDELVGDVLDYSRRTDPRAAAATDAGRLFDLLWTFAEQLIPDGPPGTGSAGALAELIGRAPRNSISADHLRGFVTAQERRVAAVVGNRQPVDALLVARLLGPIVYQALVARGEIGNALLGHLVLLVMDPEAGVKRTRRPS
ncbi:TetR/AcrR family transcriptional regulator [Nakamurella leprariae]|uniref:TetR/AcrR family transcriptional regulator n=1 Tax=Nakamurella leprariae TaxID=2803911 RepID=A0A939C0Y9_9ACTN|nr:helix-turn-helix domain-containing protein [Nakamurella leprariae]MBM9466632.1 TetR/AcrR family transcriptional regulator [Nakamurella leprariae]